MLQKPLFTVENDIADAVLLTPPPITLATYPDAVLPTPPFITDIADSAELQKPPLTVECPNVSPQTVIIPHAVLNCPPLTVE